MWVDHRPTNSVYLATLNACEWSINKNFINLRKISIKKNKKKTFEFKDAMFHSLFRFYLWRHMLKKFLLIILVSYLDMNKLLHHDLFLFFSFFLIKKLILRHRRNCLLSEEIRWTSNNIRNNTTSSSSSSSSSSFNLKFISTRRFLSSENKAPWKKKEKENKTYRLLSWEC